MNDSLKLAALSLGLLLLASCAQISSEASRWNGQLSYNPANGRWEVSFSRPGGIGDGKAAVAPAKP